MIVSGRMFMTVARTVIVFMIAIGTMFLLVSMAVTMTMTVILFVNHANNGRRDRFP